jgi:hypothetical protein
MRKDEEVFKRNKLSELYKQLTNGQKDKFSQIWDYCLKQVPPKDLDRAILLCERTIKSTEKKRSNGKRTTGNI